MGANQGNANHFDIAIGAGRIDIVNATDIGAALADGDEFLVYDLSETANKKSDVSRLWTYTQTKLAAALTADRIPHGAAGTGLADSQLADGVSGGVLTIAGTLTDARSLTLPDAALNLSQITGGLAGADATLLTGTLTTTNAIPVVNADDDLVEGSLTDDGAGAIAGVLSVDTNADSDLLVKRNGTIVGRWKDGYVLVEGYVYERSTAANQPQQLIYNYADDATGGALACRTARGANYASPTASQSGDLLGRFTCGGYANSSFRNNGVIDLRAAAAPAGNYIQTYWDFQVDDGAAGLASVMHVDDDALDMQAGIALEQAGNVVLDSDRLFHARSYAVASLPAAGTAGRVAYASDGRKAGEGAGAGTGVLVFDDGSNWIACDTGATVAA